MRVSEAWGQTTVLQLALEAKDMKFVSHGGIQVTSEGLTPATPSGAGPLPMQAAGVARSGFPGPLGTRPGVHPPPGASGGHVEGREAS